jgi:hypothetical protein
MRQRLNITLCLQGPSVISALPAHSVGPKQPHQLSDVATLLTSVKDTGQTYPVLRRGTQNRDEVACATSP